jgi:translocation and assembly module TamA
MCVRPQRPNAAALVALAVAAPRALAGVELAGIDGEVRDNAESFIGTTPDCAADDAAVARFAEQLPARLRPALDAFGYYSAELEASAAPRSMDCWQVRVAIERGPPTLVRSLSVRLHGAAEHDDRMQGALASFPLATGDVLRHGPYLGFKSRLETLARERGYLEGHFSVERIEVHVRDAAADVELEFDSGPRYRFGAVTFDTSALSEPVLNSFVSFAPGDFYDAAFVARLQRDLTESEYFATVDVAAELDVSAEHTIPIRVNTTTGRPVSYSIGGGYSTDDGPRFRFLHRNRRLNDAGHQMRTDVLLSPVRQSAVFDYRVPLGNPQRDWLSFRTGLEREDIDAGVGSTARLGLRRTRVTDAYTITRSLELMYELDETSDTELATTLLVPGTSWMRTRRDDLVRPREGHRLTLDLSAGLGSGLALLRAELQGKWITTAPWGARLLVRGRVGATVADKPIENVPLGMRFFAGGDSSVRGYDYESLGPRNDEGELIGGDRLFDASVEYEHPVRNAWSVAAFVDAGNAFLADDGFDAVVGAGIGARWLSPLGPVRVDIAWPRDGEDRSPQLHISLGPDL